MKKILRLVTTSVLTLTLVACGEASSSVASSTPVSSSVSSPVSSTFAAVTRIDLSAATDSLVQVLGAQKTVVVTATLSANANPAQAIEWFVDGAKSNQTGRVFEFTPAKAGAFVISARVGSVNSTNTYTVNVGAPAFKVESAKFTDNKTIEIKAPAGASVAVTGNELLADSRYDIVKETYFINLKTALKQGDAATVTFTTESGTVTEVVTFDTRAIDIKVTGGATDNKDGTYTIVRPHELNASTKVLNTVNNTYTVTFQSTNLGGTQLPFKLEQVSVPTGATAIAVSEGLINVATTAKADANSLTFNVTRESIVGSYVFKYTLNGVSKNVTLIVEDTEAEIKLAELQNGTVAFNFSTFVKADAGTVGNTANVFPIYASEADIGSPTTKASTAKFNFLYQPGTQLGLVGVVPNAAGEFEITKDYLPTATAFKEFAFKLTGDTFRVPTNLREQAGVLPNQALISVSGPGGSPLMRTQYKEQLSLPVLGSGFRDSFDLPVVRQRVDASTPEGKYTYTLRVLQLGVEIMREEVVVVVKAPASASLVTALASDSGAANAIFTTEASNIFFAPRLNRLSVAFPNQADIAANLKTASALTVDSVVDVNSDKNNEFIWVRLAFLSKLIKDLPDITAISEFNYDKYIAARTAWVNSVTTGASAPLKFAGGATVDTATANYSTNVTAANATQLNLLLAAFGPITGVPGNADTKAAITNAVFENATASTGAYSLVVTAFRNSLSTFLNVTPLLTDIDSQPKFDIELAKFKAKVELLYPTYEEFVNAGAASAEFKPGADGVYEIQKPIAITKDSKSLVFNLNLTNFESPINAGATIPNSYLNGSTKRELLNYIRTVSGPVLLPNHAINNVTSKVAIELDSSGSGVQLNDTVQTQEQPTQNTYPRFSAASHSASQTTANKVVVPNIAIIDVDFLTPTGVYTYNISLGSIVKTISVRVVNPTPKLTFGLTSTAGVFDSNSNKAFTYNATEDKYYASLGVDSTSTNRAGYKLELFTEGILPPASLKLPYIFTLTTPTTTQTRTFEVLVVEVAGNDGKFKLNTTTGIDNLTVETDLVLDTVGTYILDLTLAGQRKVITLVVNKYPTLKDVVVNVGTTKADVFGTRALIPSSALAFNIAAASDGLPSGTLYYTLGIGTTANSGLIANNRGPVAIASGVITDTQVFRPLDVATIPVQLVTDGSSESAFDFATNADLLNKVRFIQVNIFQRVNVTGFNPLVPRYNLIHVGHRTVEIWYGPNNVPTSIIASDLAVASLTDELRVPVTSDSAGTVYALVKAYNSSTASTATVSEIIAQPSLSGTILGKGTVVLSASGAVFTGTIRIDAAASTAYDIHYVVVGENNISALKVVRNVTTGAVLAASNLFTLSTNVATYTVPSSPAGLRLVRFVTGLGTDRTPALEKIRAGVTTFAELQTELTGSPTFAAITAGETLSGDAGHKVIVLAISGSASGAAQGTDIIHAWDQDALS
jgi:hypothetical protein